MQLGLGLTGSTRTLYVYCGLDDTIGTATSAWSTTRVPAESSEGVDEVNRHLLCV